MGGLPAKRVDSTRREQVPSGVSIVPDVGVDPKIWNAYDSERIYIYLVFIK